LIASINANGAMSRPIYANVLLFSSVRLKLREGQVDFVGSGGRDRTADLGVMNQHSPLVFTIDRITQQNQSGLHPIESLVWLMFYMFLTKSGKEYTPRSESFSGFSGCERARLVGSNN